jgi:hypothetical protein
VLETDVIASRDVSAGDTGLGRRSKARKSGELTALEVGNLRNSPRFPCRIDVQPHHPFHQHSHLDRADPAGDRCALISWRQIWIDAGQDLWDWGEVEELAEWVGLLGREESLVDQVAAVVAVEADADGGEGLRRARCVVRGEGSVMRQPEHGLRVQRGVERGKRGRDCAREIGDEADSVRIPRQLGEYDHRSFEAWSDHQAAKAVRRGAVAVLPSDQRGVISGFAHSNLLLVLRPWVPP